MITKLTAPGGSRCAAMTWVTAAGTPTAVAAHAQAGALKTTASAARPTTFNLHALERMTLLK
jgi:hypothetical protein